MFKSILASAAFASAMVLSVGAHADVYQTFDLEWSGKVGPYGSSSNTATASAVITFDLTQVELAVNGSTIGAGLNLWITSFSLTVSGASAGNGTFSLSDFGVSMFTNGGILDFTEQLVGQPTSGKPWATTYDGSSGDFNLIPIIGAPPTIPVGITFFTMVTNYGSGDSLTLTSFAPEATGCSLAEVCATTPLPAALPLFASGLGALGLLGWRRKRKAQAA